MAKITLNTIGSRYGSIDALNDNFDSIEAEFENTLRRDGTGPNNMQSTLDMDSNAIINIGDVRAQNLYLNNALVVPTTVAQANNASAVQYNPAGTGAVATTVQAA